MVWWVIALRLTGLGWYIATCIVVGVVGGVVLDKLIHTSPLFTLLGTVVGSVVAFWGVYKMILPVLYGANRRQGPGNGGLD